MAVVILAWALLVPPFSVPDEAAHFSYVQSLAEKGERPPRSPGPLLERAPYSTEERAAYLAVRGSAPLFNTTFRPAWSPSAEGAWRAESEDLRRDDIEALGPQAVNPPLYYLYETVSYKAASGGDFFDRMLAMRLWSGLLMLVTVAGAWLLVGELVRDRTLQLAGAACVGLQPMATFISAGVNPDALLYATFALGLWLAVRVARRGATAVTVAGLVAAALAAAFVKPAGAALVPAVVLVLGVALARRYGRLAAAGAVALGVLIVGAALLFQQGLVENRTPVDLRFGVLRGFATYLWDFYLPRLPFQFDYGIRDNAGWNFFQEAWAAFGFLEVRFPNKAYAVLALVVVATFVGATAALLRRRFEVDRLTLAIFALTALTLLLGIHWADFQQVRDRTGHIIQGRYLLPLMPIVAVAVAAALSNLPRGRRPLAAAGVLAGMGALQLVSMSMVAGRFLA